MYGMANCHGLSFLFHASDIIPVLQLIRPLAMHNLLTLYIHLSRLEAFHGIGIKIYIVTVHYVPHPPCLFIFPFLLTTATTTTITNTMRINTTTTAAKAAITALLRAEEPPRAVEETGKERERH